MDEIQRENLPSGAREDPSTELSSRRTGMSFQRTRLSAERTLMSVIRTSLSLVGFGFTIHEAFGSIAGLQGDTVAPARRFGVALVLLGTGMLVLGIGYHIAFMGGLRRERTRMKALGLIHAQSGYPVSLTLLIALGLLTVALLALASVISRIGPLS
jgi:putative membrane protein